MLLDHADKAGKAHEQFVHMLISQNQKNEKLINAAKNGDFNKIQEFIDEGARVDAKDSSGSNFYRNI